MMKKMIAILLIVMMTTALLSACGSAGFTNYDSAPASPSYGGGSNQIANESLDYALYAIADSPPPQSAPMADSDSIDMKYESGVGRTTSSGTMPITAPVSDTSLAEKIIYYVSSEIETLKFDETIDRIYELLLFYNAFIESSNISGINIESSRYNWNTYRNAYFSLRVPKENLNSITANLDSLGNVISLSSYAQNITSQFYDSQSRLNSLEIQEERLLDMLKKAEDVPDLIALENRISEVRYQIEALTTTLRNWQNQVDYSTLTINVREVEIYTEPTPIHRSYWQQVGDGFNSSLKGVGTFFTDIFKWFVVNLPTLILLLVIGLIMFLLARKLIRSAIARNKANNMMFQKEKSGQPEQTESMKQVESKEQTETEDQAT